MAGRRAGHPWSDRANGLVGRALRAATALVPEAAR
jgi:hypothetical protein